MANNPLHQHALHLTDPNTLYQEFHGKWRCDNCGNVYDGSHTPYHCKICQYDLCQSCFHPKRHLRHHHELYLSNATKLYEKYNGEWSCDACQVRKGPPKDSASYHCFQDDFDLCQDCFKGRMFDVHQHPLVPADAERLYNHAPGMWQCDNCQQTGSSKHTPYSWHCLECQFDFCTECLTDLRIKEHEHPLKLQDAKQLYAAFNGRWQCDLCHLEYEGNKTYHCSKCKFDACYSCVKRSLGRDPFQSLLQRDKGGDVPAPIYPTQQNRTSTSAVRHSPPCEG